MRTGDRVKLPGGGTGHIVAPADAAGLALVRVADGTLIPVPAHQLRRESLDELAARAALRPRTGRVLNLGPVRPHDTGSPRVSCAGTEADCGTDAALLHHREASAGPGLTTSGPDEGDATAFAGPAGGGEFDTHPWGDLRGKTGGASC